MQEYTAATAACRDFSITPLEVKKGIVGRVLKFAGYMHHYESLPGNTFGLILKNKLAAKCVFQLL